MSDDRTFLTDQENYRLNYRTYLKYFQPLPPQREWMKTKLRPRLGEIFNIKKRLTVLAVGSGSGETDNDFLNEIISVGKEHHGDNYEVVYQVVEPNASSIDLFRSSVEKNEAFFKVTFKWFTGILEDFSSEFEKTESEDSKFDFVHYVRCFYYIDSVKGLNMTYDHFLKKGGIVAVVGENGGAFGNHMMRLLNDHEMKTEEFTCSGPVSMAYFLPGWISQADEKKWKHETHTITFKSDITPIFDETSQIGNSLIDFIMHAKESRKKVKKEIMNDFFKLLENLMVQEDGKNENGVIEKRKYIRYELGAIIITKE